MSDHKSTEEVSRIFASVSSPDSLLFHVAHARKENSDKGYDGDELVRISNERIGDDLDSLLKAAEIFRTKSIPR
jgi:hypothetical protein